MSRHAKACLLPLAVVVLIALSGCGPAISAGATLMETGTPRKKNANIVAQSSYGAADMLVQQAGENLRPGTRLAVIPLKDLDHPAETTSFATLVAQQIGTRLSQLGYEVVQSETRDTMQVTGSYASGRDDVMINLRLMTPAADGTITAFDYSIPRTPDVRALTKTAEERQSFFNF